MLLLNMECHLLFGNFLFDITYLFGSPKSPLFSTLTSLNNTYSFPKTKYKLSTVTDLELEVCLSAIYRKLY